MVVQPFEFGRSKNQAQPQAQIGIFGGSGFYQFLENATPVRVETPYGAPSDDIMVGTLEGKQVAFLPRHGKGHTIPPHKINYRANVWALKSLGCQVVVSPCAAGSLQKHIAPGHFVVCDQFVDRSWGRADTFYDGPVTTHVSAALPFNEELRQLAIQAAQKAEITVHAKGTVVVIQGPRFSSHAESVFYRNQGWEVINMTQYPEVQLVKELNMHSVNISLITDYDSGVDGIAPVSHESVVEVFNANNQKLRQLLFNLVASIEFDGPNALPPADYLSTARL